MKDKIKEEVKKNKEEEKKTDEKVEKLVKSAKKEYKGLEEDAKDIVEEIKNDESEAKYFLAGLLVWPLVLISNDFIKNKIKAKRFRQGALIAALIFLLVAISELVSALADFISTIQ